MDWRYEVPLTHGLDFGRAFNLCLQQFRPWTKLCGFYLVFLSFSFIPRVENETLVLEHPLDSLEREKEREEQKVARTKANQSIEDEDHSGLYHAYYFFIELYCH